MEIKLNKYGVRYIIDNGEHRRDTYIGSFKSTVFYEEKIFNISVPTVYNPKRITELPYFEVYTDEFGAYFEFIEPKYVTGSYGRLSDDTIDDMMNYMQSGERNIPWTRAVEAWDANKYCGLPDIYSTHCKIDSISDYSCANYPEEINSELNITHIDKWMKIPQPTELDSPFIEINKYNFGDNFKAIWGNIYSEEQIKKVTGGI